MTRLTLKLFLGSKSAFFKNTKNKNITSENCGKFPKRHQLPTLKIQAIYLFLLKILTLKKKAKKCCKQKKFINFSGGFPSPSPRGTMPKSLAEVKISAAATQRPSKDNDRQVELQVISSGGSVAQGWGNKTPSAEGIWTNDLGQNNGKADKKLKALGIKFHGASKLYRTTRVLSFPKKFHESSRPWVTKQKSG